MRAGGASLIANCGYGRGFSVLDVLDTVTRVHGKPFEIRRSGRRGHESDHPGLRGGAGLERAQRRHG